MLHKMNLKYTSFS